MPRTTKDPVTVHVWLPDMRSLCDRRPRQARPAYENLDESALDAYIDEQTKSPICGACLTVANYIRTRAGTLIAQAVKNDRSIHPPVPANALRALHGTRWALELDLDEELPAEFGDAAFYRTSITDRYTDDWLITAAERAAKSEAQFCERTRVQWRAAQEAQPADNRGEPTAAPVPAGSEPQAGTVPYWIPPWTPSPRV